MVTLASALGAIAVVPAAASATTWFGSSLNHEPANAGHYCDANNDPSTDSCTRVGSDYPGTSGRAMSPVKGIITAINIRPAGPMTFRVKVVKIRNLASNFQSAQAKAVAVSRLITTPGPTADQLNNNEYPVETFKVHLKVKKGQELAIDTQQNTAEYCSNGTPGVLVFDPALSVGQGFQSSTGVIDCLQLVQAVVKHG
jgi:hypothetical protein